MKKLTALLLALLMLALPVLGSAATTDEIMAAARENGKGSLTTVTFVPGDLTMFLGEENAAIYKDVLNALGLSVYSNGKDGGQGGIAVSLQGNEVLQAEMAIDEGNTFYLKSNVLGADTVAVNPDEWQPLLEKLIDLMAAADAITAEDAAILKQQIASAFAADGSVVPGAEEAFVNVDWTPVEALLTEIMADAKSEAVTEQPADCDQAVTRVTCTFTPEDVVKLYTVLADCLRADANAMAYLNSEIASSGMTAEQFLTEMVAAIEQSAATMQDVPATYYISAAGNVVRMDMTIVMDVEGETVGVPLLYTRNTTEQGVLHTVTGTASVGGTELLTLGGTYLDAGEAGLVAGEIAMNIDEDDKMLITADCVFDDKNVDFCMNVDVTESGEQQAVGIALVAEETDLTTEAAFSMNVKADGEDVTIGLTVKDEQIPGETAASGKGSMQLSITTQGVTIMLVGDYTAQAQTTADGAKKDTVCDVKLNVLGMDIPLLTVNMTTETCEPRAGIVSADALHIAAMTDEELEAYGAKVAQSAQIALVTLVQNLPASVLQLLMAQ